MVVDALDVNKHLNALIDIESKDHFCEDKLRLEELMGTGRHATSEKSKYNSDRSRISLIRGRSAGSLATIGMSASKYA